MTATDTDYRGKVIFSRDGQSPEQGMGDTSLVTKLVIGRLDKDETVTFSDVEAWIDNWQDLNKRFPNLTHLHLWGIEGLTELPRLPSSIERIDIRHCTDLQTIETFDAENLDALILEGLLVLDSINYSGNCNRLRELAINDCPKVNARSMARWIQSQNKHLATIELTDLPQLESVSCWPENTVDIRCNNCAMLKHLPRNSTDDLYWPEKLRRLELLNCRSINKIAPLPLTLDYVNLAGMKSLEALPKIAKFPSTLFLYNSGITLPPVFQHGGAADENVAESTRKFFAYRGKVGSGDVKRCKVVLLGNGSSGKTTLALRLSGGNPMRTHPDYEGDDKLESTHGVIFHTMEAAILKKVDAHLWDFGGQEIYHNTHRLFLSTGSIFLLLWNPNEKEDTRKELQKANDENADLPLIDHRPLSYWLDYIKMASGKEEPRVAIVCSKTDGFCKDAKDRLEEELREYSDKPPIYYIDAQQSNDDTLKDFNTWISDNGKEIVEQQGTCVPSYWQIAQEMVERWIAKMEAIPEKERANDKFTQAYKQIPLSDFEINLHHELDLIRSDSKRRDQFPDLVDCLEKETNWLTEQAAADALAFLDNISWVYWKPKLGLNKDDSVDKSRVIIGQRWALDGIYTLLKRNKTHPDDNVYSKLEASGGRFTLEELKNWGWDTLNYKPNEQKLLLSFLLDAGLCFHLDHKDRNYWEEGAKEYICLAHLPKGDDQELQKDLELMVDGDFKSSEIVPRKGTFHRGCWDQILAKFGERFGRSGQYYKNHLLISPTFEEAKHGALIKTQIETERLNGKIEIKTIGPKAVELHSTIHEFVDEQIDRISSGKSSYVAELSDKVATTQRVFISYKKVPLTETAIKLCEALKEVSDPQLDQNEIKEGDSIADFMDSIKSCDYAVVFLSDAYFESPWCMWELWQILNHYANRTDRILIINLCPFKLGSEKIDAIREYWSNQTDFPAGVLSLKNAGSSQVFQSHIYSMLNSSLVKYIDTMQTHNQFDYEDNDKQLSEWVCEAIAKSRPDRI